MSMHVLESEAQIQEARQVMRARKVSAIEAPLARWMRRFRLLRGIAVGDVQKSWDVLFALDFLAEHVAKGEPVADIGCYASEVLVSLHKMGYTNLTGIDLNPQLATMPFGEAIRYQVCDFMSTPFEDSCFKAITSISVIEHGFDPKRLLAEMSRLLMPGGYFVASFDYWPDKIDTRGTKFFGMDWLIFSRDDVRAFVDLAATFGLHPTGALRFDGKDKTIQCAGKAYTFACLVMKKSPP
jgi:SAM-dependent methyltransferase